MPAMGEAASEPARVYRRRLQLRLIAQAIADGRRLAAVRPLHGAGAVRARPGLLRQRQPPVRLDAGVGQRLRHRAGAVAAVRPGAGARRWRRRCEASDSDAGAGSSAPARARWPRSCSTRWATRVRRYRIVDLSAQPARAPARALARFGDRVRWLDALPERDAGRGRRQRGARRDAGAAAALRRQRTGSSAASCRRRQRASPGATGRPRCAPPVHDGSTSRPATVTEIHPQAEAFVAHAGRPPGAAARRSSSTTAFPTPSTTTRSASAAR